MIRLYLKISVKFVRLIFLCGFCVVRIQFVRIIKLKLAQFLVDHLANPIVSTISAFTDCIIIIIIISYLKLYRYVQIIHITFEYLINRITNVLLALLKII